MKMKILRTMVWLLVLPPVFIALKTGFAKSPKYINVNDSSNR